MVEKRNRLKATREGSLLGVLIDVEISDQTLLAVKDLVMRLNEIERRQDLPVIDDGTNPELLKYQRDSR